MKIIAVDQSLTGTALCGLEDGRMFLSETITFDESVKGFERVGRIRDKVRLTLDTVAPDVFVMEDYSGGANINTMIPLVELGGVIKMSVFEAGYRSGRDAVLTGKKIFCIQAVSSMKKFCLGDGTTKKDSRYLLTVFEKIKQKFENDNEADAYMHAWMAGLVIKVARGEVPIGNLPMHQQEALISKGVRTIKGLSLAKALKLSDELKLKYVGF